MSFQMSSENRWGTTEAQRFIVLAEIALNRLLKAAHLLLSHCLSQKIQQLSSPSSQPSAISSTSNHILSLGIFSSLLSLPFSGHSWEGELNLCHAAPFVAGSANPGLAHTMPGPWLIISQGQHGVKPFPELRCTAGVQEHVQQLLMLCIIDHNRFDS